MSEALYYIAFFIQDLLPSLGSILLLTKVFRWQQSKWCVLAAAIYSAISTITAYAYLNSTNPNPWMVIDYISLVAEIITFVILTKGKWYKRIAVILSIKPISSIIAYAIWGNFVINYESARINLKTFVMILVLGLVPFLMYYIASFPSKKIKCKRASTIPIVLLAFALEILDIIFTPDFIELYQNIELRHSVNIKGYIDTLIFLNNSGVLRLVFLAVLPFIVIIGINLYMSQRYYKVEAKNNAEYLESQAKYYENIKKSNSEIRKLRHDYRNHLTVLSLLIDNGEDDRAKDYIKDLNGSLLAPFGNCNTGNDTSDAIVSDKISKAKDLGINLTIEGKFSYQDMKPIDICTILGNILDNAIEAVCRENKAHTISSKDIKLEFITTDNFFMINETNRTLNPIKYDGTDIISSKQNKELHGLGLNNIKDSAKKYNGDVDFTCDLSSDFDNEFIFQISVMLPIKS